MTKFEEGGGINGFRLLHTKSTLLNMGLKNFGVRGGPKSTSRGGVTPLTSLSAQL